MEISSEDTRKLDELHGRRAKGIPSEDDCDLGETS
jgi:hypothetical protein